MAADGRNFYLVKIGPKSLGDGLQGICKDKESINLGPIAGYKGWNYPDFSCIFVLRAKWNFCSYSLSKGIFNALKELVRLASAMEWADGDKQHRVFFAESNGGIFSGKKLKSQLSSKILLTYVNLYSFKGQGIFSLDVNKTFGLQITLCKECNHWITQLVLFTFTMWQITAIDHATYDLLTKHPELCSVPCGDELAWNLNATERLTLYYDSVEDLGRLACFKRLFFSLRAGVTSESSTSGVTYA